MNIQKYPNCRKCGSYSLYTREEPNGWVCIQCDAMWTSVPLLEWVPNSSDDLMESSGYLLSTIVNASFGTKLLAKHFCGYCFSYCKKNHTYCSHCGIKLNGKIISKENVKKWFLEIEDSVKINDSFNTIDPASGRVAGKVNYSGGKMNGEQIFYYLNSNQVFSHATYKDGKREGIRTYFHINGEKRSEELFKEDERISCRYWNSKGQPVDSLEEARK